MIQFTSLFDLMVAAFIIQNIVVFSFLGLESLNTVGSNPKQALKLGVSLMFILPFVSAVSFLVYNGLLFSIDDLGEVTKDYTYLNTILFVFIIVAVVVLLNMVTKKVFPKVYAYTSDTSLSLTTNTVLLGSLLLSVGSFTTVFESFIYGFVAALGYTFVLVMLSFTTKQLEDAPIPKGFKGLPLQLIILAIIALIFSGFGS